MPPVGVTTGPVPEIEREALAGEDVGVGRMVDEFDEAGGELIGAELDEFDETDEIDDEDAVEVDFDDAEDVVVVDDFDEAGFGGPRSGDDIVDIDVGIDEVVTVVSSVVVLTVVVVSSPDHALKHQHIIPLPERRSFRNTHPRVRKCPIITSISIILN